MVPFLWGVPSRHIESEFLFKFLTPKICDMELFQMPEVGNWKIPVKLRLDRNRTSLVYVVATLICGILSLGANQNSSLLCHLGDNETIALTS
jgi:hypothetical protein